MQALQSLDIDIFRFVNGKLANSFLDQVMPFLSGNAFFYPVLLLTGVCLIWKGGRRGLVCVLLLALILPMGDHWICRVIKKGVARPRPFSVLTEVRQPGAKNYDPGKITQNETQRKPPMAIGSMPSSHAANWFAAVMIGFIYYRPTLLILLPAALLVSFSRLYNGVHYPSDVLAGGILGAGYAAASVWCLNALWQRAGPKWFPLWFRSFPSLLNPELELETENVPCSPAQARKPQLSPFQVPHGAADLQWLRLGYFLPACCWQRV